MAKLQKLPSMLNPNLDLGTPSEPNTGVTGEEFIPLKPITPITPIIKDLVLPNVHPKDAYNFMVNFTTRNSDGETFEESHAVDGPTGSFNNPLNPKVINGNQHGSVVVVPISNKNSEGAYFLKFHLPQPSSSTMFVTFCQKSSKFKDGYYDFIQGIPDDYRLELRKWIFDKKGVVSDGKNYTKDLVFSVKGVDTNKASASVEFIVSFGARANSNNSPSLLPSLPQIM